MAKRYLRDGDSKASTYKDAVSLLGKGQLLGLGDSQQCGTCFGGCGAAIAGQRCQCGCDGGDVVRVLGCLVAVQKAMLELLHA